MFGNGIFLAGSILGSGVLDAGCHVQLHTNTGLLEYGICNSNRLGALSRYNFLIVLTIILVSNELEK